MKYKKESLEKAIQRSLNDVLQNECEDPRLSYVYIPKVILSNDLSVANVYYTISGTNEEILNTKKVLFAALPFLKRKLVIDINTRKVPELKLKEDKGESNARKVEEILNKLKDESKN